MMAGNYIESQTPIMQNGDFYYPLTTAKQTILPDGRRLGSADGLNLTAKDVNALSVDLTDVEQGTATGINADTLGGKAVSAFVLEEDLDAYKNEISSDYATKDEVSSNYLLKTETAVNSNLLGGKAPIYYIQPRNLLDNSDFTNPINQRGQTSYTGNIYGIDRWKGRSNNTVINIVNGGISVSGDRLTQIIEPSKIKPNVTYTLVAMDVNGNTDYYISTFENGTTGAQGTVIFKENNNYVVRLDSKTWAWAALYEGTYNENSTPPYMPKGYATELMECYRYYWKTPMIFRSAHNNNVSTLNIQYPCKMRSVPVASYTIIEGNEPSGFNQFEDGISYWGDPNEVFTFGGFEASADL